MTAQTLLLSAGYEPIRVVSWQRAITLLSLGKIEVLEEYDTEIRSPTVVFKMPAVVRFLRVFKRYRKPVKFSRVNIYARDNYSCQYCAKKLKAAELTFDHVLPRSRGGKTNWENIVAACQRCNREKGSRTPREASMKLLATPTRPDWVPVLSLPLHPKNAPEAWRDYLYWTGALDIDE